VEEVRRAGGGSIDATIRREDFESWIAPGLARIEACADEALVQARLDPAQISKVSFTGGTPFVPAVHLQVFD